LSYYKRGNWIKTKEASEEVLKRAAKNALRESLKVEIENPEIEIHAEEPVQASNKVYTVRCAVRAKGEASGIPVEEEIETEVKITLELCLDCSRKAGGFFEAILQLRGPPALVKSGAPSLLETLGEDQKSHITSIKELKEGTDLYFASTAVAKKSSRQILEKFGGTIKESAHLHTKDKSGHDVYRVTISLRLPQFVEGDVIKHEGTTYQVTGFGGSGASLFDIENRTKQSVSYKSLERAEKPAGEVVKAVVLEAIKGRIQVMEQKNYSTIEFYLDLPLKPKDEVAIFKNDSVFLLQTETEYQ
jgi:nonsense-mediated mRNA decay protein 3